MGRHTAALMVWVHITERAVAALRTAASGPASGGASGRGFSGGAAMAYARGGGSAAAGASGGVASCSGANSSGLWLQ